MALGRVLVDVQPLRESPAFRRLWVGSSLSIVGSMMTSFAVTLQVWTLTESVAAVGAVGLAAGLPAVVLGLVGGTIVDAFDRRTLVLITSSALAVISAAFTLQAFAGLDQLWLLYLLVALQSLLSSVDGPARRTFTARLIPPQQFPAATALMMLSMHSSVTVGPLLAGALSAGGGLKTCYLIDTITFAGALYGVARLPPMRTDPDAGRPGLTAIVEGLRYIRTNRVVAGALLADLSATVLGMPFALFPAINSERFGGSSISLGMLTAAVAVGGILASGLSGPVGRVSRQGAAMLIAGAVWGVGLLGFGLAGSLWLAVLMLMVAGGGDAISVIFRVSMIQSLTPDRYRGRTSAAEYVIGAACPKLGDFRAGAVGSLASPTVSAISGGLTTIAGAALIAVALPALARYQARTNQEQLTT
ncbi:MAG TPA: MFS transporter [Kineosporiaceae bacterium]|nr:MFS transporter [Kineosporiaceae bacterium]